MRRIFRDHGLSIVMLGLFFLTFLVGQVVAGRKEYNEEQRKHGKPEAGYAEYLGTGHFGEATAENWESEFLQMFVYVLATAFLYQKGSAESKDPRERHVHKSRRSVKPDAPWPVRRGGWVLRVYEHSLSLALFLLFLVSLLWHARGGLRHYNEERANEGEALASMHDYLTSSRFWFEAFQNWQSEFLSIGAMVLLTIWLREANSPESKQVDTPHWDNEE
jgi:hypothetical protein